MKKWRRSNVVAGLDPAFGGEDRAILQLGSVLREKNVECLVAHAPITIPFPTHTVTVNRYLATQVAQILRKWNCPPEQLAIDTTAAGQGVWEELLTDPISYGRAIAVHASGKASDTPIYAFDGVTAHEIYANRGTEAWAIARAYVRCSQIRGMHMDTAADFTSRQERLLGGKTALEDKRDFRERTGRSPDFGDGFALMCVAAKEGYGLMPGEHLQSAQSDTFEGVVEQYVGARKKLKHVIW